MSIEKGKDLFWRRVGNIKLRILFSNIFACKLVWRKMNIFFINVWKYFLILQTVFKWQRLKEISVYHQHTVGMRGHALLWSGMCVGYGKVYNKCTMSVLKWLYNTVETGLHYFCHTLVFLWICVVISSIMVRDKKARSGRPGNTSLLDNIQL